jgi:hypothetical protein
MSPSDRPPRRTSNQPPGGPPRVGLPAETSLTCLVIDGLLAHCADLVAAVAARREDLANLDGLEARFRQHLVRALLHQNMSDIDIALLLNDSVKNARLLAEKDEVHSELGLRQAILAFVKDAGPEGVPIATMLEFIQFFQKRPRRKEVTQDVPALQADDTQPPAKAKRPTPSMTAKAASAVLERYVEASILTRVRVGPGAYRIRIGTEPEDIRMARDLLIARHLYRLRTSTALGVARELAMPEHEVAAALQRVAAQPGSGVASRSDENGQQIWTATHVHWDNRFGKPLAWPNIVLGLYCATTERLKHVLDRDTTVERPKGALAPGHRVFRFDIWPERADLPKIHELQNRMRQLADDLSAHFREVRESEMDVPSHAEEWVLFLGQHASHRAKPEGSV